MLRRHAAAFRHAAVIALFHKDAVTPARCCRFSLLLLPTPLHDAAAR